ncbi:hypothetical protein I79_026070 [Cricetulus griseus]|uniref:Uncharacterized protein n=1 Tax=Cricetulus griseus TaxID=10029 RepID=G3IPY5_CRIGR|nr:hypothetical protein I79_026070 [Cricetulus griseus]
MTGFKLRKAGSRYCVSTYNTVAGIQKPVHSKEHWVVPSSFCFPTQPIETFLNSFLSGSHTPKYHRMSHQRHILPCIQFFSVELFSFLCLFQQLPVKFSRVCKLNSS